MEIQPEVTVRPMTLEEFATFREHTIREYAAVHVSVGNWTAEESIEQSTQSIDKLLPDGVATDKTLLLTAVIEDSIPIGYLWIGLERGPTKDAGAWIYDIELYEQFRGKGYGRALLKQAEVETKSHGVNKLGLNVFGSNTVARNLYESAGYITKTLQMSKEL